MQKKWWHDKIAYQIYPKSFQDSNGDGIGDIPGIISRLDYLKELGVDILWICPCYASPMVDQGYDISDYYNIDPMFGSMEDMDRLIDGAKKRGMYILMDLVVNHCSSEHEWFKKACGDPNGEYGEYFIIRKRDGEKMPTNWRSYFGGSVWSSLPGHPELVYYHSFHEKQPDLNWKNPKVREEVFKNINWWLDKGLGGFRVDAIINVGKPEVFHDYPADRPDGLADIQKTIPDSVGVKEYLTEMNEKTFRPHEAFSVGEVMGNSVEELPDYIGEDGYFSAIFDFGPSLCNTNVKGWYAWGDVTPDEFKQCSFKTQRETAEVGWVANIIENHDQARGVSRFLPKEDLCDDTKKLLAAEYFYLRGMPFIYQGQELGMENVPFTDISQIEDISTLDEYKVALRAGLPEKEAFHNILRLTRDNARTPMQWTDGEHAGFTTGEPWLMLSPDYKRINARAQENDPHSVLSFYKQMIALRKNPEYKETFTYGETVPVWEDEANVMAYIRSGEKKILVAGNFGRDEKALELGELKPKKILLTNRSEDRKESEASAKISDFGAQGRLILKPYQVLVVETE